MLRVTNAHKKDTKVEMAHTSLFQLIATNVVEHIAHVKYNDRSYMGNIDLKVN